MELIEGTYKSVDGKDYYELALNLHNGEKILIKNAGCTANAFYLACEKWGIKDSFFIQDNFIKIFFLGTKPELISEKIPKKYHKLVFDVKNL